MTSVCFYFQLHQPPRLRRYSVFDSDQNYFDDQRNRLILERVANKCYLPATQTIYDLVNKLDGQFKVAYSMTGCIIEQLKEYAPQVITLFEKLADTGCVEFLGETYNHSLSFLYSRDEFKDQIELHSRLIENLFGQTPRVFRNTELIYSNELAEYIASLGTYSGIITEGADQILEKRSPNFLYHPPGSAENPRIKLLLKNYKLSDDIAFRFSNTAWKHYPLTPDKYVEFVKEIGKEAKGQPTVCNLFMDYETFGEHQWKETGIFEFLNALPEALLETGDIDFKTPSQCIEAYASVDTFNVPHMISWADTERDLSAWLGNAMQSNALHELYRLEIAAKECGDTDALRDWRLLTTSDHFYYMCTKYFDDGNVHKYFNPYESPYDSYINFMNVLDNLRTRINTASPVLE